MPPKKPTESEARKGIEKIIDSKRKPPVKTLTKGVDKESTQRTKGISSVASSVSKMQNNMSKKIIEVERLSSEKSISKVQSSMTKILGSLNNTIANLATGVKDITIQQLKQVRMLYLNMEELLVKI